MLELDLLVLVIIYLVVARAWDIGVAQRTAWDIGITQNNAATGVSHEYLAAHAVRLSSNRRLRM